MYRDPLHGDDDDDYNYRGFGDYREYYEYGDHPQKWHMSIDAGDKDNFGEVVYPVLPGYVVETGWDDTGFGSYIIIKHSIEGTTYYSLYAHLGSTEENNGRLVTSGYVDQNTPIGTLGNSTRGTRDNPGNMTPHLHFEIRYSQNVNPTGGSYLYGRRYWAFDSNWKNDFFDLGLIYGYTENPSGFECP